MDESHYLSSAVGSESEYDQEILHSHTAGHPEEKPQTRHQEDN